MSKRGYLNAVGLYFGIKRKWFGIEPNFMFRKRIMRKITDYRIYSDKRGLRG